MAVCNELSTADHQPSEKLANRSRKPCSALSQTTHSLGDALTVSLYSITRQSSDSKSCSVATSRKSKKAACSGNLRASSFHIPRSDQSLHRDSPPKRDQIGRTRTPRTRSTTNDKQDKQRRSLSKSSKSTEKRSDEETRSSKLRKQMGSNRSLSSTRPLKTKGEKSESSRSLGSSRSLERRARSSCNRTKSQTSRNASTSSKTASEGRTKKSRSNSCEGTNLPESRRLSTKGSMDTSGRSPSSQRMIESRKIPRGIDPPPTQLVLVDTSPSKNNEMKSNNDEMKSPARPAPISQRVPDRVRSSSFDKAIRSATRTMERAHEGRRSDIKTPRSSSGRSKKTLGRAISTSPCRKIPAPEKSSRVRSPQNKLADLYTPTPTKRTPSLGRSYSSAFLTAQDSLSLIETHSTPNGSALTDHKRERKLRHTKSCTGADLFRTSECLADECSDTSISPLKRAASLGSSHFQSLQDSLSLITLSQDDFELNDIEHRRRSHKGKSFSGIDMYLKSTMESLVKKPKLVSKHFSQRTKAFKDIPRSKSVNVTYQRECFRSTHTY